ncbi:hypothetical protein PIB30_080246 [Stylosanthes scabra]|uniref:Uncharacterized protein n=1 Tax=Stylosanthes scabra TaxID=79078 RepID=A0ABU6QSP2_9FABA|nr:hypothetical protein [Stylosanthes scabra]
MSPSGMILFSPTAARAFQSPAHVGTSSQPEFGPDHPAPFTAHTQEHTGLDELLYHMLTCPPAEFASLASTYRMTRASHDPDGASSSAATLSRCPAWTMGSHLLISSGYGVSSVRSESHWFRCTIPVDDTVTAEYRGSAQSAEAPQAPQPRRTTRAVRPPPCGTGGHMHPRGGEP